MLTKITDNFYIDFETIRAVYSEDDGAYLVIQYKDSEHFLKINDKKTQDLLLEKLNWLFGEKQDKDNFLKKINYYAAGGSFGY